MNQDRGSQMIDPSFIVLQLGTAAVESAWKTVKDSALRTLVRIASKYSNVAVSWSDQSVEDLSARTTEVPQAAEIVLTVTSRLETEAAAGQGSSVSGDIRWRRLVDPAAAAQRYEAEGPKTIRTVRINDFIVVYRPLRDPESARLGRQGFVVLRIIDDTGNTKKLVAEISDESQEVD